jgi:hypothetical protein
MLDGIGLAHALGVRRPAAGRHGERHQVPADRDRAAGGAGRDADGQDVQLVISATYRLAPSGETASAVGTAPTLIGVWGLQAGMAIGVTVVRV